MTAVQQDHEILDDADLHRYLIESIVPHPWTKRNTEIQYKYDSR
jgi:hypothetical protein